MTEQRLNDLLIRSLTSGRTMSVLYRGRSGLISFSLSGTRAFDASTSRQRYDGFVSFHPYMSPDIALYIGELLHRGSGVAKRNYGS
jgi:hypothetical protein